MVQIVIKRVCLCPACDGAGIVQHHAWQRLWESSAGGGGGIITHKEMLERMDSTDSLPPMEVVCANCNGTKNVIINEVVDIETMAEMIKPYLNKNKD